MFLLSEIVLCEPVHYRGGQMWPFLLYHGVKLVQLFDVVLSCDSFALLQVINKSQLEKIVAITVLADGTVCALFGADSPG